MPPPPKSWAATWCCSARRQSISKTNSVVGYVPDEQGTFRRTRTPIPKVVHNRSLISRYPFGLKTLRRLARRGVHVFNPVIDHDKYNVHKLLRENASLRPYLPETVALARESWPWFKSRLPGHGEIFLKPRRGSPRLGHRAGKAREERFVPVRGKRHRAHGFTAAHLAAGPSPAPPAILAPGGHRSGYDRRPPVRSAGAGAAGRERQLACARHGGQALGSAPVPDEHRPGRIGFETRRRDPPGHPGRRRSRNPPPGGKGGPDGGGNAGGPLLRHWPTSAWTSDSTRPAGRFSSK